MNSLEFGYNFAAGKLLFGITIVCIAAILFLIICAFEWVRQKLK